MRRLVTLAGQLKSAEQAARAAQTAADVHISGRHLQRLTQEVGTDLARLRDAQATQRRRQLTPRVKEAPPVAVVEVDGGRLGTRAAGVGPGVQQPQPKEDKLACLLSMASTPHAEDPQPEPPAAFRDAPRVARLVRQLKASSAPPADASPTDEPAPAGAADEPWQGSPRPGHPERRVRTCVASMKPSREFGRLVAAEAQLRAFYDAPRRAFVADGQHYNWRIQRTHFREFEAIADFIHVLCYLYLAAWAVREDDAARWQQFETWMTACWQGRVAEVVTEVSAWHERLGRPPPEAEPRDPRQLVAEALTYLGNNAARMDYPRYRRQGLPVTSSLVESLVGEFNERVKGWDKWWNRTAGAEAILQVRAAVLSEDQRLERYFAERACSPYRRRRPRTEQTIS